MTASSLPRPFFERDPREPCPEGRLLLLSPHFPPGSAAGALRWQKLARFTHERGFGLDVVTLDPSQCAARDDSRLDDLPPGTRVFGVRAPESRWSRLEEAVWQLRERLRRDRETATRSAGAPPPTPPTAARPSSVGSAEVRFEPGSPRSWLRAYWAWLDFHGWGLWAREAAGLARRLADGVEYRLLVSCGPPHMAHEAGRRVASAAGLPWVADLRDPWSQGERIPERLASPVWYRLAARYERRMVQAARLIVMNTEPAREALAARYPERRDDIVAIPNACDDNELPHVERGSRLRVAYAGSIYLDRTPDALFAAVARLVSEERLAPEELAIEFMGHIEDIDGETLPDIARRHGIADFVQLHPPRPFAEAERFLAGAGVLLSLPQDSHLAIPSKVYEYMRHSGRMLVMAEEGSATERLLRGSEAHVVDPLDVEALLSVLREALADHRAGRVPRPLAVDARYSRRARAAELFAQIDRRLGVPGPPASAPSRAPLTDAERVVSGEGA